jgi:hypothetical protein
MQSGTEEFLRFIEFLLSSSVLSASEIKEALAFLDGVGGVISEGTFILGYEGLARFIGKKLSFDELKSFTKKYSEVLTQDADARYFFAQSLVEKRALQQEERRVLISLMPSNYQPFLLKRFS